MKESLQKGSHMIFIDMVFICAGIVLLLYMLAGSSNDIISLGHGVGKFIKLMKSQ